MTKKPKDFLYSYQIYLEREIIGSYFSDAAPPPVGTILELEDVLEQDDEIKYPYRVEQVRLSPIYTGRGIDRVSTQTRVDITVVAV